MKKIFTFTTFVVGVFVSLNSTANSLASCEGIRMCTKVDEKEFKCIQWEEYSIQLTVSENTAGKYGLVAHWKKNQEVEIETDVKGESWTRPQILEELRDGELSADKFLDAFIPGSGKESWSARYFNINVGGSDDGMNTELYILLNKSGETIGKLIRYGWGFGVCVK